MPGLPAPANDAVSVRNRDARETIKTARTTLPSPPSPDSMSAKPNYATL